jgi:hypothetical protein
MPGKAITQTSDPFVVAARLREGKYSGNDGFGEEKYQLMTKVICAGNKKYRFRIGGAGSL